MPERRRVPPPWSIEELEACFVVVDITPTMAGGLHCLKKEAPGSTPPGAAELFAST